MLSKRYESTEVDRRTWLHVPSGTHWSTSSDTHQVVEIQIETSTKMYTPFEHTLGGDFEHDLLQLLASAMDITFVFLTGCSFPNCSYSYPNWPS